MVMRQLSNVSTHNEHNCLSQDATKASFPEIGSERPGKGKKQNPRTNYNTKSALLWIFPQDFTEEILKGKFSICCFW